MLFWQRQNIMATRLLNIDETKKVQRFCTDYVDYEDILEEKISDVQSDLMHETMKLYTMQNNVRILLEQTQDKKAISLYSALYKWNPGTFHEIREKTTDNIHSAGTKKGKMVVYTKYPHGISGRCAVIVKDTGTSFDGVYDTLPVYSGNNSVVLNENFFDIKKGIIFSNENPLKTVKSLYQKVHEIYTNALLWHQWLTENNKEEIFEDLYVLCDELVEKIPPTIY